MDRAGLKVACRFFGGIKAVATMASVDDGNLSKWLRGQQTLSEAKVANVFASLGLPSGKPDMNCVHVWNISRVLLVDYSPAFALYFPKGGEIAKAPWTHSGIEILKIGLSKFKHILNPNPSSLYAVTDGHTRAIIRMSKNLLLQPENIKDCLSWRGGTAKQSYLNLSEKNEVWTSGIPTPGEFDAVWNDTATPLSAEDVMAAIRSKNITIEEAIQRIRQDEK